MNTNDINFKTCYLSDSGVFIKNKGCFVFQELEHFAFWLVVDGVEYVPEKDGAQLVVDQLCSELIEAPVLSRSHIKKCLNHAHNILKNAGNGISLKASLALVVTDYSEIIWAISGNSRLYLIREHQLLFRSRDQSVAQSLVDTDIIDEDGMTTIADRDILTNYLGIEYGFSPYISKHFKLKDGDVLLLCSLGFWDRIRSKPFNQLLQIHAEPNEILSALQDKFLGDEILNNYIVGLVAAKRVLSKKKPFGLGLNQINFKKINFDNSKFNKMTSDQDKSNLNKMKSEQDKSKLDKAKSDQDKINFNKKTSEQKKSNLNKIKSDQDKSIFNKLKFAKIKLEKIKFDQPKMVLIISLLLIVGVIISAGVLTKARFAQNNFPTTVQNTSQTNTSADEQKADLLAKEGNYAEALAQYDRVLTILQTNPDKKTEATIRLKISIILMLKEGDEYLAKQHYEIALSRYDAARNFDVPNYFQFQIENKIANVKQLVNQHLNDQPVSDVSEDQLKPTADESKTQSEQTHDKPAVVKEKMNNHTETTKPKVMRHESSKPIASTQDKNNHTTQSNSVAKNGVTSPKARPVSTSLAKSTGDKVTPKRTRDVVIEKPASTGTAKSLADKDISRPTTEVNTDQNKLSQAVMLVKQGDDMLYQQNYRDAVRCYKKAKRIYRKLKIASKVAQLDGKIQEAKSRMRNSYEGSH